MFQVQLSFVVNLSNVFLVQFTNFSFFLSIIIIISIIIIYYLRYHPVAIVLTPVQTKQIRIIIHKRNYTDIPSYANYVLDELRCSKHDVEVVYYHSWGVFIPV